MLAEAGCSCIQTRVLVDQRTTKVGCSWTQGEREFSPRGLKEGEYYSQRRPKEEGVECRWTRRGGSSTERHGDRDEFPVLEQHPHWQCCVCLLFSGKSHCFYLLFQFYSDHVFIVSIVVILVQLYIECWWTKGGGSRVLMDPYKYTQTDVNEQQIKF